MSSIGDHYFLWILLLFTWPGVLGSGGVCIGGDEVFLHQLKRGLDIVPRRVDMLGKFLQTQKLVHSGAVIFPEKRRPLNIYECDPKVIKDKVPYLFSPSDLTASDHSILEGCGGGYLE